MKIAHEEEIRNARIYLELERKGYLSREVPKNRCDILHVFKYEISWDTKDIIGKMPPIGNMSEDNILRFAQELGH